MQSRFEVKVLIEGDDWDGNGSFGFFREDHSAEDGRDRLMASESSLDF